MSQPFNGDTFIQEEFLRLKDKYSLTTAVETGTNHGDTTVWLARNFLKTVSCEIDQNLVNECARRFADEKVHVELVLNCWC